MYVTLVFWLALFFPGYAVVRRWFDDESESGLLGVVALSYLLTLGLLSPVSILCYVLRAPVWVFAAYIVVIVVAALADLTRTGSWRELAGLGKQAIGLGLLIVALDIVSGAMVGGYSIGDAQVHLARIRFLTDHGFSNLDPFVSAPYFYPIYHTNLLHALHAGCVKLTGVDRFGVWFVSLAWAKVLVNSAAYYLAWCIFKSRLAGWAAALFSIVLWSPVPYTLYPNKIAPLFVVAMMFAFVVRILAEDCTWRRCTLLAIGALLLGQIHALYGAFAGLALGPPLCVCAVRALAKKRPDRNWLMVAVVALTLAGPFLFVSAKYTRPREVQLDASGRPVIEFEETRRFHHFDNNWIMYRFDRALGNYWWLGLGWGGVAVVIAVQGKSRRGALAALGILGTVSVFLYVPPLCTLLLRLTEREWILARFGFVLPLGFTVFAAGSLAVVIEQYVRLAALRHLLLLPIAALALLYGFRPEPFSWSSHIKKLTLPAQQRQLPLRRVRQTGAFAREHIEPGATVLTSPEEALSLVMLVDCYVVAARSSSNGVLDLPQRRADLETMIDVNTSIEERNSQLTKLASLLAKYNVRYYLSVHGETPPWRREWVKRHWYAKPWLLIEFDQRAIER